MLKTISLLDIDLRLFDGAAGGAGAAGSAGDGGAPGDGAQQGGASTLSKAESRRSGSSRRSRSGAFDNVVFGKQDAAETGTATPAAGEAQGEGSTKTGVETTSDSKEAKRQAFKNLIDGEYKEEYSELFQNTFDRRFKETKAMEQSLSAQKPIIDMLSMRYGIPDGDMAKLQTAIEQDEVFWDEAAEAEGLTREQFVGKLKKDLAMQKLQSEYKDLQRMQAHQNAQQRIRQWHEEGEKLKAIYPSFDLDAESKSKDFRGLLQSGVSVQKAYETIHMDEIKEAAAKTAAQTAGQQMVANLQKKAARPAENGTSSQSAVITKSDVHSLTRKERAEAARRAERGHIQKF